MTAAAQSPEDAPDIDFVHRTARHHLETRSHLDQHKERAGIQSITQLMGNGSNLIEISVQARRRDDH